MPTEQAAAGRDAKGRIVKGASGNPSGRPKEYRAFREQARAFMDGEGVARLLSLAQRDSEFALKLLAEYAYGKPQQHMDVTSGGQPLVKAYGGIDVDKACP